MRVAPVAERGGDRAAIQRHLPHHIIERGSGDAGADERDQRVEDLGGEPPGLAHGFEPGGAMEFDRAVARHHIGFVGDHIVGHAVHVAALCADCEIMG